MARKTVLLLVLTVLLAGCVGGIGGTSDSTATTATTADTGGSGSGGSGGSGGGGSGSGGSGGGSGDLQPGTWDLLEFDQAATYTYDIFMEDQGHGTLVFDVQSVEGDSVTVRTVYDLDGDHYESTISGTRDMVQSQLYTNPAGAILLVTMFTPATWYADQRLEVGSGWSYQTQDGSASFDVTGVETYAGVDCYRSEMRVDGEMLYEGCFSPDLGLAPYTAYYNDDGSLAMEMELVSYERH